MLAALPLLTAGLATGTAHAQNYPGSTQTQQYASYNGSLQITGFNVEEVNRLAPGTDLNFSVYGSPGGTAILYIAGAQRALNMSEVDAGQYEGRYTISNSDKITSNSSVTANLRLGNQVVSMVLSESLQAGVGYRTASQTNAAAPKISKFDVQPAGELRRGNDIGFTLTGTPGAKAEMSIAGAKGTFFLQEVKSGEYSGVYTIKKRDRIESKSAVTATLRNGDRSTKATLNKPLLSANSQAQRYVAVCTGCGVVEAVNVVEVKGDGNYLGTIGGGVIGALLGNQVGGGSGKTAATIAGAVGGALAGRAIEGNVRKDSHYEVLVRLQNGGTQTASFDADPGYKIGDRVKITDGVLVRDL